ncbi:Ti-type conjugative transfer relaxase TraA [Sphingosinicella sp. CPCC 101087]|uniref:Ti-type conjugative transfer relaxase TraA n=1 Tax=Sphingosinicella sp. CPCC 101087 TaxID=2497754 RepID=UPI00101B7F64|nr:Ti-type conjugative transfer relaxase TraA [Sphingosinicella sp. CPCC 101087]
MAIYHFSAKVISRANGSSALAAAAYRSASRLHDQRLDRHHDFSNKAGVIYSEVMLPEGASEHLRDRERLWNAVEAAEKRIDAQLAREIEFAIPRELVPEMGVALARDFVTREFVGLGMVADLNVHWDVGADGQPRPHAHVMLSMREVGEDGFGAKVRDWNRTALLQHWREAWAAHVNQRLAELDIDARIDHRSLEAQGIDLEPQNKIGPAASRVVGQGLESERLDEHLEIARRNGERILANPAVALDAITHGQATFTTRDLAMFVHRHSDGKEQFDKVMAAVRGSPELVRLGRDGRGNDRFTSRTMIEAEKRLEQATVRLEAGQRHGVAERDRQRALARAEARGMTLSSDQRGAFEHVTNGRGLSNVIGYAGSGKSAMLGVAREAWEQAGYHVQGAALSGIAAENLEHGSGIASRTLASLEHQWAQGSELLTNRHVLVIDEAGMIGTRQMERVIAEARKRQSKVVLVGDVEQLQAIEAGAAFRSIAERHGAVEITAIRRQEEEWQRDATRQLATGRTAKALTAYHEAGHVHAAATRDEARERLIEKWERDREMAPGDSRIILAHTNEDVRALNEAARVTMRGAGELGEEVGLKVSRGERAFASGDRIMFLRNERSLGVKNGSLGSVRRVDAMQMQVLLDDGRSVMFDHKDYADLDHGYAATIHKAQGMTVDRVHVLATPGLDRHAAYVALSRHRRRVDLHYGEDDFADRSRLVCTLRRERGKDMASDYAPEPDRAPEPASKQRSAFAGLKLRASPSIERALPDPLGRAVERYGRAVQDVVHMRRQGYQPLPHQQLALARARDELEALQPQGAHDLRTAMNKDLSLIDEAARGQPARAIRAMAMERKLRIDTADRAERFVTQWKARARRMDRLGRSGDYDRAYSVKEELAEMSRSLQRDPQLESLVRNRRKELGIGASGGGSLSHDLQEWLSRSRSLGIGM